jgi:NADH-quinone oxidoreductase subunit F
MAAMPYAAIGTEDSTGPKLFCSPDASKPGVYEVPFGATLRDLIELAGGVAGGKSVGGFCSAAPPASSSVRTISTCR